MLNKFPYKLDYVQGKSGIVAAETREEAISLLQQQHSAAEADCVDFVPWANHERPDIIEPGVYPD